MPSQLPSMTGDMVAAVTDDMLADPLVDLMQPPVCPYCGQPTVFMRAGEVTGDRRHRARFIYACLPCQAWVGCHPGDIRPLGSPANQELRYLRAKAHGALDGMRARLGMTRRESYEWLSRKMGLSRAECHIGMFREEECETVIQLSMQMSLRGDA